MFSPLAADALSSQEMGEYIEASILNAITAGTVGLPWWVPRFSDTLKVIAALVDAVNKYNSLHEKVFGEVEFSMPSRLSPEELQRVNMTFGDFLESNDLYAISGFLTFAHAAQGYGYVGSIPALYGLWWITPELLAGYVQMSFHQKIEEITRMKTSNPVVKAFVRKVTDTLVGGDADAVYRTTTMLPEGYGKLWQRIYEREKLDVRFGVEDLRIDRQLDDADAPVVVEYTNSSGGAARVEFDFLVYTAAHAHAQKYVGDLTSSEAAIFDTLESYVLATTLYESDPVAQYSEGADTPIMYNVGKMLSGANDGEWYADRNDPLIFAGESRVRGKDRQLRVAYQFYESPCEHDASLCDADRSPSASGFPEGNASAVLSQLGRELEAQGVSNVAPQLQFAWPYFHHFPLESIAEGTPWDLLEMQGESKTWWLGASACFESVHDNVNYNLQVLSEAGLLLGSKREGDGKRSRRLRAEAAGGR